MTATRTIIACLSTLVFCAGMAGPGCDRKVEQIKRGMENVDQRAKDIENELDTSAPSTLAPG